jgi:preprotein translocase subunit SecD
MCQPRCLLAALVFVTIVGLATCQDDPHKSTKKLPNGVYAVLREGAMEKDVRPLKDGEALAVHNHRYAKKDENEPPRFLVVRTRPDVELELAGEPKAVKEGDEVVRILLKLQPKPAAALERLTADPIGKELAIVLAGEVVTTHKVRETIKGGDVQITSCAAGAAKYLLEQLRQHQKGE